MILTAEQRYKAEHGMDVDSSGGKRGSSKYRLWPGGVVVYTIESRLGKFSQIFNNYPAKLRGISPDT